MSTLQRVLTAGRRASIALKGGRGRNLSLLSRNHQPASAYVAAFKEILGADNVMTEAFDIEKYTVDWTKVYKGGSIVCFPRSTEDVSNILQFCNKNRVGVVPQGGNTGLVGGAVGLCGENESGDQLIMSMEKMNKIISIDESVLICESGCILENLNIECAKKGYIVPLDLGSKHSCMIGGNVASNAGGLRVVRYGTLHANILGLEVVQADGTVLNMIRTLRKDNCGYHLNHLFIGSEGTLGVITKVSISLALKPTNTAVVWAKVSSFAAVSHLLKKSREEVGDILSAFEFVDGNSIAAINRNSPKLLKRLQGSMLPTSTSTSNSTLTSNTNIDSVADIYARVGYSEDLDPNRQEMEVQEIVSKEIGEGIPGEVCVLMEFSSCSGSRSGPRSAPLTESSSGSGCGVNEGEGDVSRSEKGDGGEEVEVEGGSNGSLIPRLELFLENLFEEGLILDAIVSQNKEQENELWAVREQLPVCLMQLSRGGKVMERTDSGIVSMKKCIKLYKYDVSISLKETSGVVAMIKKQISKELHFIHNYYDLTFYRFPDKIWLEYCCFGHAGDQNLHLNILLHYIEILPEKMNSKDFNKFLNSNSNISDSIVNKGDIDTTEYYEIIKRKVQSALDRAVFKSVLSVQGSVSAEHGVGQQKTKILSVARSPVELSLMAGIKRTLDPVGILNPGKVIPDGYL